MTEETASAVEKLTPIEARGDHFQVGLAMGRAAAGALADIVPRIGRFLALKNDAGALKALGRLEAAARDAFPELMREVDGIAEGSGMDFRDVWLWNCRGDFAGGGDQSRAAPAGCTTVMIPGGAGAPNIIGHNEDDQAELDGHCFLARVVPDDGPAFLSFYSPGLLPGHTFGVNDAGLVQTINHIRPFDQREGIPRHVIARAVLSQSSLGDALTLLRRNDRASGFHHNLAQSGDARMLSVEAPAGGCNVEVVSDEPRAHTNHLIADEFAELDQELAASSRDRLRRARELIAGGALAARDPRAVLHDAAGEGLPIYRKGGRADDSGFTLATTVFEIEADGVAWRVYTDSTERAEHAGRVKVR